MKKTVLLLCLLAFVLFGAFAAKSDWSVGTAADMTKYGKYTTLYTSIYGEKAVENDWSVYGQAGIELTGTYASGSTNHYFELAAGAEKPVFEFNNNSSINAGVIVKSFFATEGFKFYHGDYAHTCLALAGTLSYEKNFDNSDFSAFAKILAGVRHESDNSLSGLMGVIFGQLSVGLVYNL